LAVAGIWSFGFFEKTAYLKEAAIVQTGFLP
jgi:hypothetical protein